MSKKQCLQDQLARARRFSQGILADFERPEEWTHQVHERANHALWFVGHMGVTDDFMISLLDADQVRPVEGYRERFGVGSHPSRDPSAYPPPQDVVAYMNERRATLLAILDRLEEAELATPTPPGAPDFLPDFESIFQTAAWHEGLHAGQVTVAHRALGHDPVMGRGD